MMYTIYVGTYASSEASGTYRVPFDPELGALGAAECIYAQKNTKYTAWHDGYLATLTEQNGWSHTWIDQTKSDAWSVKEVDVPKGYTVTYQKNGFVFTVTNTSTLIQTGQLKWPIPILAGAGLLLFVGGWILYFKGKRKDHA